MVKILEISEKRDLKKFIDMQWSIYKGDENWVPPLKGQMLKTLLGKDNALLSNGPHTFFLAFEGNRVVGRVLAGINTRLNSVKNKNEGYISLFESIDDEKAAFALLDKAVEWLEKRGVDSVVGPVSPSNGDDSRGILVQGFDGSPVLMNSYNPPYYERLFEVYGFIKDMDLYAYYLNAEELDDSRSGRVTEYAMKKFNFRISLTERILKGKLKISKQFLIWLCLHHGGI